jgi:hypothetical protein
MKTHPRIHDEKPKNYLRVLLGWLKTFGWQQWYWRHIKQRYEEKVVRCIRIQAWQWFSLCRLLCWFYCIGFYILLHNLYKSLPLSLMIKIYIYC